MAAAKTKPVLLDQSKYGGQYVALRKLSDKEPVAHGLSAAAALKKAKEKGVDDPIIFFIPENGVASLY